MNERHSWLNTDLNNKGSALSGRREEMRHLTSLLLGFVKNSLGITCTFSALATEACAFFQLAHAGCSLLSSSDDIAVGNSFADAYVHRSDPVVLVRKFLKYKCELLSKAN